MNTFSPAYDLVVRGGTVVTADGTQRADIGVNGQTITVLADDLSSAPAQTVIDASDCFVVPGAIDVHTHFGNRVGEHETADDYESGTVAAAFGGITTFINYCAQSRGESLELAIERERAAAEPGVVIDFGLHVIITDPGIREFAQQVEAAVELGVSSIKIFTAVDAFVLSDAQILQVLRAAQAAGALVNLHAEDGPLIADLTSHLIMNGETGMTALPKSRPPIAEAIAITKVAGYAHLLEVPLYVVHVASAAALTAIGAARDVGAEVYAETRPAYLFLDESVYNNGDRARFVACWPPLRSAEDQAALWQGLSDGTIQTYATDHTSWMAAEKLSPELTFDSVPGGFANVETSIGMLFNEGVGRGRFSLERFVEVTATNPARIFGLWPRKGTIAVGSDADLVVIDPNAQMVVSRERTHSRSDVEPYEGYEAAAWPVVTISRGQVLVDHGKMLAQSGRGQYLHRSGDSASRTATIGRATPGDPRAGVLAPN